jgi:ubiquinone/menaquinone biosynthesis C-methylase UbiE
MTVPDWQLPPGVNRGLWDYLHDSAVARNYDEGLADSSLFNIDLEFAERYFNQPGRIIDLGCGTGRLLLNFAQRGYWVLGVDLSEAMLARARDKAAAAGLHVHLVKANLVELDAFADQSFDYAACLFSTLGMIQGSTERLRVIQNTYRLLRPGGRLLLHVHNRWFNAWNPEGRRWLIKDWLTTLTRRTERGNKLMPVHQGVAGLTLHLFTRREIKDSLKRAGFRIDEIRALSLRPDGRLPYARWFGFLRSYGYLVAAHRPD